MNYISTFSIVAYDPNAKEWGVAVQSRYFAVSTIVSWSSANIGAMATQSFGNPKHWEWAKPMLKQGVSSEFVMEHILKQDRDYEHRQIGIVDQNGFPFVYTGKQCRPEAYHIKGGNYTIQGNLLHQGTLEAMQEKYEESNSSKLPLCDCLMACLMAGQEKGGDIRGMQSAGILITKEKGGYLGANDTYIDLHVDDHIKPLEKLQNLLEIHKIMYKIGYGENLVAFESIKENAFELLKSYGIQTSIGNVKEDLSAFLTSFNINHDLDGEKTEIDQRIFSTFCKRLEL